MTLKKLFPILLLLLLAACTTPAPSPTLDAVDGPRVTATPPARASVTPKPTATKVATVTVTSTSTPSVTPSPTEFIVTITPPAAGHDPLACHGYAFFHTHGDCAALEYENDFPGIGAFWNTYGQLEPPWRTSEHENTVKHSGNMLSEFHVKDGVCNLFDNDGNPATNPTDGFHCIEGFVIRIHNLGTGDEARASVHSYTLSANVCEQLPGGKVDYANCVTVHTGGWLDTGFLETNYKENYCPLATDWEGFPGLGEPTPDLNQPQYHANPHDLRVKDNNPATEEKIPDFWNGLGCNAAFLDQCVPDANQLVQLAYGARDAFEIIGAPPLDCADPTRDMVIPGQDHSTVFVFTVKLARVPLAPFVGWVDLNGAERKDCTEATLPKLDDKGVSHACVPLVVVKKTGIIDDRPAFWNLPVDFDALSWMAEHNPDDLEIWHPDLLYPYLFPALVPTPQP